MLTMVVVVGVFVDAGGDSGGPNGEGGDNVH